MMVISLQTLGVLYDLIMDNFEGRKAESFQKTYSEYEIEELEGQILNLGERDWGVTEEATAVYAAGLDTCALVVLYDREKGDNLIGAVHYRSPKESEGAIREMYRKMKFKTGEVAVGIVRGRLCGEQSENLREIKKELKGLDLAVPAEMPQGNNGVFWVKEKKMEAVRDAPQFVKDSVAQYYRDRLIKAKAG